MKKTILPVIALLLCLALCAAAAAGYTPFTSEDAITLGEFERTSTLKQTYNLTANDVNEQNLCQTIYILLSEHCLSQKKGEQIKSVTLENRTLTISVYLPRNGSPLPAGMYANGRANNFGELIAANDPLMECWDTLVFDFEDLKKATFTKSDMDSVGLKMDSILRELPDSLKW